MVIEAPSVSISVENSDKELKFERHFYLSRKTAEQLNKDIMLRRVNPIDDVKAIEAAKASVFLGDSQLQIKVIKLELLNLKLGPDDMLEYYLINVRVSGSEELRMVLPNGTVLKPEMKRVASEK